MVKAVIDAALHFLGTSITDDPAWASADENFNSYLGEADGDDEGDDRLKTGAAAALDRISRAIGGKTVWPLFFASVSPMMGSTDWKQRTAGLLALSLIAEGCRKVLAPQIKEIVRSVIPFLSDAHPRVRHAGIRTLGQLIIDFQDPSAAAGAEGTMGERSDASGGGRGDGGGAMGRAKEGKHVKGITEVCGEVLLQALVEAAGEKNKAAPRLRGLAAASLVNLFDPTFFPATLLTGKPGVLDTTLATLFALLRDVQMVHVSSSTCWRNNLFRAQNLFRAHAYLKLMSRLITYPPSS